MRVAQPMWGNLATRIPQGVPVSMVYVTFSDLYCQTFTVKSHPLMYDISNTYTAPDCPQLSGDRWRRVIYHRL